MDSRITFLAVTLALVMIVPVFFANSDKPASAMASSAVLMVSVPEEFNLRYSVSHYNETHQLTDRYDLTLSSNGSAHYVETWPGTNWPEDIDASAQLGQELIDHLRNAMNDDGICSLNGTYNDAGWHPYGFTNNVENLTIQTPCGNRTLKFYGEAMVGILPYTYVAIQKIIWRTWSPETDVLNISVEVSAQLGANAIISISASVRNNAIHYISMSGVCDYIWPAKIVRSNGCSIASLPTQSVIPTCTVMVAPGDTYNFEPLEWNATGLATGRYVVLATLYLFGVTMFNITQDLGHANQAPQVHLLVSEPSDSDKSTYVFDASECCDEKDLVTDLQVRWDWYSDGTWDTGWSFEKTARHTFANMTGYNLTIEVKDSDGLVGGYSITMTESHSTQFSALVGPLLIIIAVAVAAALLLFRRRPPP